MPKTQPFSTVGLAIYYPTPAIIKTLKCVYDYLCSLDITLLLEEQTSNHIPKYLGATFDPTTLCQKAECIIVIGGDGSMLKGAIDAAQANIPLIGINRGKIGFLSDIDPQKISVLKDMLNGKHRMEKRPLLELSMHQGSESHWALNDIVLSRKGSLHLLEYDVFIDQSFVCHQRSDGVIISTPTGSTAYALSAGGPIITPALNAIGLTPLCPHTLNSRPLVIPNTSSIDIHLLPTSCAHSEVYCDGHSLNNGQPIEQLHIQTAQLEVTLMHPLAYDYFNTLKHKLNWEQKPYADLTER